MFNNQTILITGGTGSFGQEFISLALTQRAYPPPKRIIVFSRDEFKQSEMRKIASPRVEFVIGDVRDVSRVKEAMVGVDYVVHAAALKQVPAGEENPMEFVKTNIHGANNVVRAAKASGVKKVIALSTDKAANPVNLYGSTKLTSDKIFIAADQSGTTRFSVVRYGNVAGSRGSVIPFFRELIRDGSPDLPITDKAMTRFWLTLTRGVQFVLESFLRMQGGEIFIPKLPSVRVTDIAEAMAPGLPMRIVGIRPGEKLHEVMIPRDGVGPVWEKADHYTISSEPHGNPVTSFEYNSGLNQHWLTQGEIRAFIAAAYR